MVSVRDCFVAGRPAEWSKRASEQQSDMQKARETRKKRPEFGGRMASKVEQQSVLLVFFFFFFFLSILIRLALEAAPRPRICC